MTNFTITDNTKIEEILNFILEPSHNIYISFRLRNILNWYKDLTFKDFLVRTKKKTFREKITQMGEITICEFNDILNKINELIIARDKDIVKSVYPTTNDLISSYLKEEKGIDVNEVIYAGLTDQSIWINYKTEFNERADTYINFLDYITFLFKKR